MRKVFEGFAVLSLYLMTYRVLGQGGGFFAEDSQTCKRCVSIGSNNTFIDEY